MKEAVRMLQLLLLCAAYPAARAVCPPLEGSSGLFKERVEWSYNKVTDMCTANKVGSLHPTTWRRGEETSLASLGNDCLKFGCKVRHRDNDYTEVFFSRADSGCSYRDGCTWRAVETTSGTCSLKFNCEMGVFNTSLVVEEGGKRVTGQFTAYTTFRCAKFIGSGPCPPEQCFDFRAPRNTSDVCRPVGYIHSEINRISGNLIRFQCQEHRLCDNDTVTAVDWSDDIQDIPIPTTTSVPPSPETTTGPEIEPPVITVPTTEGPEIEPPVITVPITEGPEIEPPVITVPITEGPEIEPPVITVPITEGPEIEPPVITVPTAPEVPTVIFATLDTTKCRPSKRTCKFSDNTLGCKYRRQCYPVNTQIAWDDCTQFECHGSADGSQGSGFPRPTWLPRYIGCYGPSGCVTFGQKVRDPETNTLYNCTYTMGELGFPVPEFREETPLVGQVGTRSMKTLPRTAVREEGDEE